jgi:FlaA1/EpsC-like NDP-sugar epimerase
MESIDLYMKDKSFVGKNVIVTGGTGGIGSTIAQAFLKCGANTMVVSKNEKKLLNMYGTYSHNLYRKVPQTAKL